MKKRLQGLVVGMLIGCLLMGGLVFATNGSEIIEIAYSNIKIYVDGLKADPKDAYGRTVEPFIYNGTTYLPVRAVGEAIGKNVFWDAETKSVYLGEVPNREKYLLEMCPPYDGSGYSRYIATEGKKFRILGKVYSDGITLGQMGNADCVAYFNLDSKYTSLKCDLGIVDGTGESSQNIKFFVDGDMVAQYTIRHGSLPQKITVPLNNGNILKVVRDSGGSTQAGLGNMIIE